MVSRTLAFLGSSGSVTTAPVNAGRVLGNWLYPWTRASSSSRSTSRSTSRRQVGIWMLKLPPGARVTPKPSRPRMRWISSSSRSMPRIRFTSERCRMMGAPCGLRATASISSPCNSPPALARISSATPRLCRDQSFQPGTDRRARTHSRGYGAGGEKTCSIAAWRMSRFRVDSGTRRFLQTTAKSCRRLLVTMLSHQSAHKPEQTIAPMQQEAARSQQPAQDLGMGMGMG